MVLLSPWRTDKVSEATRCDIYWSYLFSGRKIEKEVRVDHRLRLCVQEGDVLVHMGGKVADIGIKMGSRNARVLVPGFNLKCESVGALE